MNCFYYWTTSPFPVVGYKVRGISTYTRLPGMEAVIGESTSFNLTFVNLPPSPVGLFVGLIASKDILTINVPPIK